MAATPSEEYFTQFIIFFSRTDVVVTVFVSLVVGALTLKYLSSNQGVEVKEVTYETTLKKKNQETTTKDVVSDEDFDEEIVNNRPPPLEVDEDDAMVKSSLGLLDTQDMEMIKKGASLDTNDPSAVKHYVQEMRTLSYKGKDMSDADLEREEEAKHRQLAQIYSLLNKQKEKFGEMSIDDVQQQMNMYQ